MTARVQVAAKACEGWGAEFERRRCPSGQLERLSQFARRRFCSRACFRKHAIDGRRQQPPGVWIDGPYGPSGPPCPSNNVGPSQPVVGRYPWDRQRAVQGGSIPGPFSAERQTNFPAPRQETP